MCKIKYSDKSCHTCDFWSPETGRWGWEGSTLCGSTVRLPIGYCWSFSEDRVSIKRGCEAYEDWRRKNELYKLLEILNNSSEEADNEDH